MEMNRKPLKDCTMRQIEEVQAETWTASLAHYEEQIPHLDWLAHVHPDNQRPMALHRHLRIENHCNEQCVLITWSDDQGGDDPFPTGPSEVAQPIPSESLLDAEIVRQDEFGSRPPKESQDGT